MGKNEKLKENIPIRRGSSFTKAVDAVKKALGVFKRQLVSTEAISGSQTIVHKSRLDDYSIDQIRNTLNVNEYQVFTCSLDSLPQNLLLHITTIEKTLVGKLKKSKNLHTSTEGVESSGSDNSREGKEAGEEVYPHSHIEMCFSCSHDSQCIAKKDGNGVEEFDKSQHIEYATSTATYSKTIKLIICDGKFIDRAVEETSKKGFEHTEGGTCPLLVDDKRFPLDDDAQRRALACIMVKEIPLSFDFRYAYKDNARSVLLKDQGSLLIIADQPKDPGKDHGMMLSIIEVQEKRCIRNAKQFSTLALNMYLALMKVHILTGHPHMNLTAASIFYNPVSGDVNFSFPKTCVLSDHTMCSKAFQDDIQELGKILNPLLQYLIEQWGLNDEAIPSVESENQTQETTELILLAEWIYQCTSDRRPFHNTIAPISELARICFDSFGMDCRADVKSVTDLIAPLVKDGCNVNPPSSMFALTTTSIALSLFRHSIEKLAAALQCQPLMQKAGPKTAEMANVGDIDEKLSRPLVNSATERDFSLPLKTPEELCNSRSTKLHLLEGNWENAHASFIDAFLYQRCPSSLGAGNSAILFALTEPPVKGNRILYINLETQGLHRWHGTKLSLFSFAAKLAIDKILEHLQGVKAKYLTETTAAFKRLSNGWMRFIEQTVDKLKTLHVVKEDSTSPLGICVDSFSVYAFERNAVHFVLKEISQIYRLVIFFPPVGMIDMLRVNEIFEIAHTKTINADFIVSCESRTSLKALIVSPEHWTACEHANSITLSPFTSESIATLVRDELNCEPKAADVIVDYFFQFLCQGKSMWPRENSKKQNVPDLVLGGGSRGLQQKWGTWGGNKFYKCVTHLLLCMLQFFESRYVYFSYSRLKWRMGSSNVEKSIQGLSAPTKLQQVGQNIHFEGPYLDGHSSLSEALECIYSCTKPFLDMAVDAYPRIRQGGENLPRLSLDFVLACSAFDIPFSKMGSAIEGLSSHFNLANPGKSLAESLLSPLEASRIVKIGKESKGKDFLHGHLASAGDLKSISKELIGQISSAHPSEQEELYFLIPDPFAFNSIESTYRSKFPMSLDLLSLTCLCGFNEIFSHIPTALRSVLNDFRSTECHKDLPSTFFLSIGSYINIVQFHKLFVFLDELVNVILVNEKSPIAETTLLGDRLPSLEKSYHMFFPGASVAFSSEDLLCCCPSLPSTPHETKSRAEWFGIASLLCPRCSKSQIRGKGYDCVSSDEVGATWLLGSTKNQRTIMIMYVVMLQIKLSSLSKTYDYMEQIPSALRLLETLSFLLLGEGSACSEAVVKRVTKVHVQIKQLLKTLSNVQGVSRTGNMSNTLQNVPALCSLGDVTCSLPFCRTAYLNIQLMCLEISGHAMFVSKDEPGGSRPAGSLGEPEEFFVEQLDNLLNWSGCATEIMLVYSSGFRWLGYCGDYDAIVRLTPRLLGVLEKTSGVVFNFDSNQEEHNEVLRKLIMLERAGAHAINHRYGAVSLVLSPRLSLEVVSDTGGGNISSIYKTLIGYVMVSAYFKGDHAKIDGICNRVLKMFLWKELDLITAYILAVKGYTELVYQNNGIQSIAFLKAAEDSLRSATEICTSSRAWLVIGAISSFWKSNTSCLSALRKACTLNILGNDLFFAEVCHSIYLRDLLLIGTGKVGKMHSEFVTTRKMMTAVEPNRSGCSPFAYFADYLEVFICWLRDSQTGLLSLDVPWVSEECPPKYLTQIAIVRASIGLLANDAEECSTCFGILITNERESVTGQYPFFVRHFNCAMIAIYALHERVVQKARKQVRGENNEIFHFEWLAKKSVGDLFAVVCDSLKGLMFGPGSRYNRCAVGFAKCITAEVLFLSGLYQDALSMYESAISNIEHINGCMAFNFASLRYVVLQILHSEVNCDFTNAIWATIVCSLEQCNMNTIVKRFVSKRDQAIEAQDLFSRSSLYESESEMKPKYIIRSSLLVNRTAMEPHSSSAAVLSHETLDALIGYMVSSDGFSLPSEIDASTPRKYRSWDNHEEGTFENIYLKHEFVKQTFRKSILSISLHVSSALLNSSKALLIQSDARQCSTLSMLQDSKSNGLSVVGCSRQKDRVKDLKFCEDVVHWALTHDSPLFIDNTTEHLLTQFADFKGKSVVCIPLPALEVGPVLNLDSSMSPTGLICHLVYFEGSSNGPSENDKKNAIEATLEHFFRNEVALFIDQWANAYKMMLGPRGSSKSEDFSNLSSSMWSPMSKKSIVIYDSEVPHQKEKGSLFNLNSPVSLSLQRDFNSQPVRASWMMYNAARQTEVGLTDLWVDTKERLEKYISLHELHNDFQPVCEFLDSYCLETGRRVGLINDVIEALRSVLITEDQNKCDFKDDGRSKQESLESVFNALMGSLKKKT
eukprot:Nk52_evm3s1636 gene=Nk52_evmTU3s1636